jgi:hypothetical protein
MEVRRASIDLPFYEGGICSCNQTWSCISFSYPAFPEISTTLSQMLVAYLHTAVQQNDDRTGDYRSENMSLYRNALALNQAGSLSHNRDCHHKTETVYLVIEDMRVSCSQLKLPSRESSYLANMQH